MVCAAQWTGWILASVAYISTISVTNEEVNLCEWGGLTFCSVAVNMMSCCHAVYAQPLIHRDKKARCCIRAVFSGIHNIYNAE